jgi:hypothetical protein
MMEDFTSWNHKKESIFTVLSAYRVEWDHQHGRKLIRTVAQVHLTSLQFGRRFGNLRFQQRLKSLHGEC